MPQTFTIKPQKRFGNPPVYRLSLKSTSSTSQEHITVLAKPSIVKNLKFRYSTDQHSQWLQVVKAPYPQHLLLSKHRHISSVSCLVSAYTSLRCRDWLNNPPAEPRYRSGIAPSTSYPFIPSWSSGMVVVLGFLSGIMLKYAFQAPEVESLACAE